MPHSNGVGATSACLREAASAKAGRPLEREAKASPTGPNGMGVELHLLLNKYFLG
jgi:hypothetical protein